MIIELILSIIFGLVELVGSLLPEFDAPAFLTQLAGKVDQVAEYLAPLASWVPFGAAGSATLLVIGACGVAMVVKLVRIVASFFTAGGGSAA